MKPNKQDQRATLPSRRTRPLPQTGHHHHPRPRSETRPPFQSPTTAPRGSSPMGKIHLPAEVAAAAAKKIRTKPRRSLPRPTQRTLGSTSSKSAASVRRRDGPRTCPGPARALRSSTRPGRPVTITRIAARSRVPRRLVLQEHSEQASTAEWRQPLLQLQRRAKGAAAEMSKKISKKMSSWPRTRATSVAV